MDKSLNSRWAGNIRAKSSELGAFLFANPQDPSRVRLIDGPVNPLAVVFGYIDFCAAQNLEYDQDFVDSALRLDKQFLWGMLYAAAIRRCQAINERLRALNPDTPEHRDTLDQLNIAVANLEYIEESASSFIKPATDLVDSRLPAQP